MKIPVQLLLAALLTIMLCCTVDGRASFGISAPINHTKVAIDTVLPAASSKSSRGMASYARFAGTQSNNNRNSYDLFYEKAELLKQFAETGGYNTSYGILLDLGMDESQKRLFVVDLATNTIIKYGIVGNDKTQLSGLLGLYQAGQLLHTMAYALQPIHTAQNQPMQSQMQLQLQSANPVVNNTINFSLLPSNGGLNISPVFFTEISQLLQTSGKPVVIWIYRGQE